MTIDEAIKHCEEVAEELDKKACDLYENEDYENAKACIWGAEEHRQLAEWLRELKDYKELSTYNRPNKCSECEYEDSEYYCDDCIWNSVNKFKQKEVNADENSD